MWIAFFHCDLCGSIVGGQLFWSAARALTVDLVVADVIHHVTQRRRRRTCTAHQWEKQAVEFKIMEICHTKQLLFWI